MPLTCNTHVKRFKDRTIFHNTKNWSKREIEEIEYKSTTLFYSSVYFIFFTCGGVGGGGCWSNTIEGRQWGINLHYAHTHKHRLKRSDWVYFTLFFCSYNVSGWNHLRNFALEEVPKLTKWTLWPQTNPKEIEKILVKRPQSAWNSIIKLIINL